MKKQIEDYDGILYWKIKLTGWTGHGSIVKFSMAKNAMMDQSYIKYWFIII